MLPLYRFGTFEAFATGIVSGLKIAGAVVYLLFVVVFATTIESLLQVAVVNPLHLLACTPVVVVLRRWLLIYGGKGKRKCDSGKRKGTPHYREVLRRLPECGNKKHRYNPNIIKTRHSAPELVSGEESRPEVP
jgi:hypothetical protein